MAAAIRFILTNLPSILFVAALIIPLLRNAEPPATRFLSWLLLLSVGVELIWGGFFHVFFPSIAAAPIGWQASPFQFEVGVADLSMGIVAVMAFWRGLEFRTAVVACVTLFYLGVAVGHVREAVVAANFAPDNFGLLLALTVTKIFLLLWLLWRSRQELTGRAAMGRSRQAA